MRRSSVVLLLILSVLAPPAAGQTTTSQEPTPLTLRDAVERARAADPRLRATAASVQGLSAAASLEGRLPNPTVSWLREGFEVDGLSSFEPDTTLAITQSIPLGGRLGRARRLAGTEAGIAEALHVGRQREVQLDLATHFLAAARASTHEQAAVAARDRLAEIVRITRRQLHEGMAAEGDLRRLEAELARVDFSLARVRIERRTAMTHLCAAIASTSCDVTPLAPPLTPRPALGPEEIDSIAETYPEVVEARARLDSARARDALAGAQTVPDLDVTAGYASMQGVRTAVAGLSVVVPLFDRHGAERARTATAVSVAEQQLTAARRDARRALETAQIVAQSLHAEASEAQRRGDAPSEVARAAAESAYREGTADVLRLLDAQRTFAETRRELIDLHFDALRADAFLRLALGEEIP